MEKLLQEVRDDVKEIKLNVGVIKTTLAVNTSSLIEHSRRTAVNEKRISHVEHWLLGLLATCLCGILGILLEAYFRVH